MEQKTVRPDAEYEEMLEAFRWGIEQGLVTEEELQRRKKAYELGRVTRNIEKQYGLEKEEA